MKFIKSLAPNQIFVFGSNANGFHFGGAARQAYDHFGAVWGQAGGYIWRFATEVTFENSPMEVELVIKK